MAYKYTENRTVLAVDEIRELQRSNVVTEYRKGRSIRAIASEFGMSYGTVRNLLKEAQEPLRRPGAWNKGMKKNG